jgi:glycosyltransferase involved in cell wall biosynthesis
LEGYFGRVRSAAFLAIERWLARHTDRIVAVSEAVREDLLRRRIGRPEQVRVVRLGLPLGRFLDLPEPAGDPACMRVGLVGRLVPIKNHELLLEVARRFQAHSGLPRLHFLVVGDGELRAALERKSREFGLNGMVTFTGWQSDMPDVYRELDIVCLTSLNEGTPVSLIEALAAGRPVVATDVGGVRDLLGPDQGGTAHFRKAPHGLLVRSNDAEGLTEAIRYLMAHPEGRVAMGRAGREFVRNRFTDERLARDIEALYAEILSS